MIDVAVFSIPMRVRFRGITVREGLLIRGEAGWGEWSPFLEYDADEAIGRVSEALGAYRQVIDRLGAQRIVAVATSAMRDAENAPCHVRARASGVTRY